MNFCYRRACSDQYGKIVPLGSIVSETLCSPFGDVPCDLAFETPKPISHFTPWPTSFFDQTEAQGVHKVFESIGSHVSRIGNAGSWKYDEKQGGWGLKQVISTKTKHLA